MKVFFSSLLVMALIAATGCEKSTTGGPGATPPNGDKPDNAQGGTFTLSVSPGSLELKQGEAKAMTVSITRTSGFHEDVALHFTGLPKGTSLDPRHPAIAQGDTEAKFTLKSDDDAALGDFTVLMMGHPTRGVVSSSEIKITIAKK